jgi:hypothetical protein
MLEGNSLSGNKELGCCCIRLGKDDDIVSDDYVIYYTQAQANQDMDQLRGRSSMLMTSFYLQNPIAVILSSAKSFAKRARDGSQYYLNNFYIHYFSQKDQQWYVHLRTYSRTEAIRSEEHCNCCERS